MSAFSSTISNLRSLARTAGGVGFVGALGAKPAAALFDQVSGLWGGSEQAKQIEFQLKQPSPAQQMRRNQRLQEVMAFNQAMLAQRFPGIYAKLLAGRELPPGAAVYGGTPNVQNVEAAALGMSMGAFGPPAPPTSMQGIMGP